MVQLGVVGGNTCYIMQEQRYLPPLMLPSNKEFSKPPRQLNERCSVRIWSGKCFHASLGKWESFENVTRIKFVARLTFNAK